MKNRYELVDNNKLNYVGTLRICLDVDVVQLMEEY